MTRPHQNQVQETDDFKYIFFLKRMLFLVSHKDHLRTCMTHIKTKNSTLFLSNKGTHDLNSVV